MIPTHIFPTAECPLCLKPLFFDLMLPYINASPLCTLYKAIRFSIETPALMLQKLYWAEEREMLFRIYFCLGKESQ